MTARPPRCRAILAGWVLPMDGQPARDAGVAWRGDRIVAVGSRNAILRLRPEIIADVPDAILLPGLINSHAHLELTALGGRLRSNLPFTRWLMQIIKKKKTLRSADIVRSIWMGEKEMLRTGTTAIADIASFPAALRVSRRLRSVVFKEVIGLQNPVKLPRVAMPLSPHAPYSISDENFLRLRAWWGRHPSAPLMMHVGESPDENKYFLCASGAFTKFYADMRVPPRTSPHRRVLVHLDRLGIVRRGLIAVHANDITSAEARLLARRRIPVVICPGSMKYFGFSAAGVRRLRGAGVTLLLGTDSAASNAELNMFRELRLACRLLGLTPAEALAMGTREPGRVFFNGLAGRLARNCFADMVMVRSTERRPKDPFQNLFEAAVEGRIVLTVLNGLTIRISFDIPHPFEIGSGRVK